jgi:hypothetical protein
MEVIQVSNGKTVVFIDGQSLFITAKTLGFSIDFKMACPDRVVRWAC